MAERIIVQKTRAKSPIILPKLDPASIGEDFDTDKWTNLVAAWEDDIIKTLTIELQKPAIRARIEEINNSIAESLQLFNSGLSVFKAEITTQEIRRMLSVAEQLAAYQKEISTLRPYLRREIEKTQGEGAFSVDAFRNADYEWHGDRLKFILSDNMQQALDAARAKREEKGSYKTAKKAGETDDIVQNLPNKIAITTLAGYENSVSFYGEGNAYMMPLGAENGVSLEFEDGKLYFSGKQQASEVEIRNMMHRGMTTVNIENLNLAFLQYYYTILFPTAVKNIKEGRRIDTKSSFYLPDLAEQRGLGRSAGPNTKLAIIDEVKSFDNIVGIIRHEGRSFPSIYKVLIFHGYNEENKTITISSPYLEYVIRKVYDHAIRKDKKGNPLLKKNGDPQMKPYNSYLVHADIQKERNKNAVNTVFIICRGIEQAGGNEYSISLSTLLDRNIQFKRQLESSSNQRRLWTAHFKKAWQLLREKTDLKDVYNNIQLPDPNNPACIPTMREKDTFIVKITHEGKKKRVE